MITIHMIIQEIWENERLYWAGGSIFSASNKNARKFKSEVSAKQALKKMLKNKYNPDSMVHIISEKVKR